MPSKSKKKTRYSDTELAEFEQIIDTKIAQAEEQLALYSGQIAELNESEDAKFKSLGESTTSMDTERLHDMASRQKKLIHHLNNAKLRIKTKCTGSAEKLESLSVRSVSRLYRMLL